MNATQELHITLTTEMANMVKEKVQRGEYATESEVIHDALNTLLVHTQGVESWLCHQVGRSYDALKSNPACAISTDHVRARLFAEYTKAQ